MPTTVTCPECDETYQVSDESAQQLMRCRRCQCPIEPPQKVGIQSRADLRTRRDEDEEGPEHTRPPLHHPSPRAPFPTAALLTIIIGILLFLLAFSVGFNIWFLTRQDKRFGMIQAEEQAAKAKAIAIEQENQARQQMEEVQKQLVEVKGKIAPVEPKQITVKQWGKLNGRVRLEGPAPPKRNVKEEIANFKDAKIRDILLKGPDEDFVDPAWSINAENQGVANVVLFLRSAEGGSLAIPPHLRQARANAELDSPFGVFKPHVIALTPKLADGITEFKTGQKLTIRNSMKLSRAVRISETKVNQATDNAFPPGSRIDYDLIPDRQPLKATSILYPWMSAYIWVFDHPYHAITGKDGAFEIADTPRDVDLRLMIWHEALGFVDGKEGRAFRLNAEQAELDLHIRAK